MLTFITTNIGTIITAAVLIIAVGAAIASIVNDRKKGKGCGCGCENCAHKCK